jgi:hypothetical protein
MSDFRIRSLFSTTRPAAAPSDLCTSPHDPAADAQSGYGAEQTAAALGVLEQERQPQPFRWGGRLYPSQLEHTSRHEILAWRDRGPWPQLSVRRLTNFNLLDGVGLELPGC